MSGVDAAYAIYRRYIHDVERIRLLQQYQLKVAGSVPSVIWELFSAVLTERSGAGNTGADLVGWEVKSATEGGSYEYQYHLHTGLEKLAEDCRVNHLFCSYSQDYARVVVKAMRGEALAQVFFRRWEPEYRANYDHGVAASQRRQRFRRAIPQGHVMQHGQNVLIIEHGEVVEQNATIIQQLNREFDERVR